MNHLIPTRKRVAVKTFRRYRLYSNELIIERNASCRSGSRFYNRFLVSQLVLSLCCIALSGAKSVDHHGPHPHQLINWSRLHRPKTIRPELKPNDPNGPLLNYRIFVQDGYQKVADLPVCGDDSVCARVNSYGKPFAQRFCRCDGNTKCNISLDPSDGNTVSDKNDQFKMCSSTSNLHECKLYTETAFTKTYYRNNSSQISVHCTCPANSLSYLVGRRPKVTPDGTGYTFRFHCSPLDIPCGYKEPCRYFTVHRKSSYDDVTTNVGCYCPHDYTCPGHHKNAGVLPQKKYSSGGVVNKNVFLGFCLKN